MSDVIRCCYCALEIRGPRLQRGDFWAHPVCHAWWKQHRNVYLLEDGSLQMRERKLNKTDTKSMVHLAMLQRIYARLQPAEVE